MQKEIDPNAHLKPQKYSLSLVEFKNFVKLFIKLEEKECEEMYMLLTKKLNALLLPQNQSKYEDEDGFDDTVGQGLQGGRGRNRDIAGVTSGMNSPSGKRMSMIGNSPAPAAR